jgi:hypothetical protein
MGNKDPAVLFYTSDFLTGTGFMTDEQVGKYIRLLCYQHQSGHLSEEDILKICKSYDKDIFKKFIKDDDGFYFNERMDKETQKRQKYTESRRINRLGKKEAEQDAEHMNDICKSYVRHMENENENINENKDVITNKVIKHKYGSYSNVLLSDEDYQKLVTEFPNDYQDRIERLSEYIASKGVKYKNHLATIRSWAKKDKPKTTDWKFSDIDLGGE